MEPEDSVMDIDFKDVVINRKDVEGQVITGDIRIATGRFYTKEEWESKRKKILKAKLP